MNFRKNLEDEQLEINLIPLIDVLLVILIFLAATTSFNRYQQLKLTLPRAAAEAQEPNSLHIAVSHDGLYALQGQLLSGTTAGDIAEALRQLAGPMSGSTDSEAAEPVLVIDADAQASHAAVVRVMEAARMVGIGRVHFATQAAP